MKVTEQTLKEKYQSLDTETLISLYNDGTLNELAESVIMTEFERRGVSKDLLHKTEKKYLKYLEKLEEEDTSYNQPLKRQPKKLTSLEKKLPLWLSSSVLIIISCVLSILAVFTFFVLARVPFEMYGKTLGAYVFSGVMLFLFVPLFSLGGIFCRVRGKSLRAMMQGAITVRNRINKRDIVYLRSFSEDHYAPSVRLTLFTEKFGIGLPPTFDEIISKTLKKYGPVVTVGFPGEELPPSGSARIMLPSDRWQSGIDTIIEDALLIIVQTGGTEGLKWEISRIKEKNMLKKTIFLIPYMGKRTTDNERNMLFALLKPIVSDIDDLSNILKERKRHPLILYLDSLTHGYLAFSKKQRYFEYQWALKTITSNIISDGSVKVKKRWRGVSIVEIDIGS